MFHGSVGGQQYLTPGGTLRISGWGTPELVQLNFATLYP